MSDPLGLGWGPTVREQRHEASADTDQGVCVAAHGALAGRVRRALRSTELSHQAAFQLGPSRQSVASAGAGPAEAIPDGVRGVRRSKALPRGGVPLLPGCGSAGRSLLQASPHHVTQFHC